MKSQPVSGRITHIDAVMGQIVMSLRKERAMDQKQLAEKIGLQPSGLSRLERGESSFSLVQLCAVAQAFDFSVTELTDRFDRAITQIRSEGVEIKPKKDTMSDGAKLALIGGAALALLALR